MPVADLVLVLAMVGLSWIGALALPADGMLPVDVAAGRALSWMPKTVALVLWPAVGVVSYLATGLATPRSPLSTSAQVGLTIALGLVLLAQTTSVVVALRRRGRP